MSNKVFGVITSFLLSYHALTNEHFHTTLMKAAAVNASGIYLAEEHPVDEALGCMIPAAVIVLTIVTFIGVVLGDILNIIFP